MNKEFLEYAEALELKQLGFDEPCLGHWVAYENKKWKPSLVPCEQNGSQRKNGLWDWTTLKYDKRKVKQDLILAPLNQQAFKWLREKHNLYHQIHNGYGWEGIIRESDNNKGILWHDGTYNSPEEAELACLRKLIEIVKSKL